MNIILIEIIGLMDQNQLVVKWKADVHFPAHFFVNIIITEIKTQENFTFKDIGFKTGFFKVPYSLPDGIYEARLVSSDRVKIVSKFKRFSILSHRKNLIETPNETTDKYIDKPLPIHPSGEVVLSKRPEPICFRWEYPNNTCICFEVFVRNANSHKVLLRKKGIASEERRIFFKIAELIPLLSQPLEWIVKAIHFNGDRISENITFKMLPDVQATQSIVAPKKTSTEYVKLHNVGIRFKRNNATNNKGLLGMFSSANIFKEKQESFWALRDISFALKEGDILGVIGNNGSGKSTLLKLLNGVLFPDAGVITVNGKVSALLSLGAGFLPNLTGRENIFLNGTFLGLSNSEIDRLFDKIVEFSELSSFIDTQIKYYSSGMKARLGFSIAVHVEPEILIVDEILGAGDKDFRQKAELKMAEFMNSARVIIIASHSMNFVSNIATQCILLRQGEMVEYGSTDKVIETYLSS